MRPPIAPLLLSLLCVSSQSLFLWLVFRHPPLQIRGFAMLSAIAFADLLFGIFVFFVGATIPWGRQTYGMDNFTICKLTAWWSSFTLFLSMMSFTLAAFERYLTLLGRDISIRALLWLWLVGFLLGVVFASTSTLTHESAVPVPSDTYCQAAFRKPWVAAAYLAVIGAMLAMQLYCYGRMAAIIQQVTTVMPGRSTSASSVGGASPGRDMAMTAQAIAMKVRGVVSVAQATLQPWTALRRAPRAAQSAPALRRDLEGSFQGTLNLCLSPLTECALGPCIAQMVILSVIYTILWAPTVVMVILQVSNSSMSYKHVIDLSASLSCMLACSTSQLQNACLFPPIRTALRAEMQRLKDWRRHACWRRGDVACVLANGSGQCGEASMPRHSSAPSRFSFFRSEASDSAMIAQHPVTAVHTSWITLQAKHMIVDEL
mgnify:CR=1 FL=1